MTRDEIIEKHSDKYVREPMSGCWIWAASVDKHGYGMLWNGRQMDRAHRVFYASRNNVDLHGIFVLHDCDNPSCVNPYHLHVGNQDQNMKEKANRGRAAKKLTKEKAIRILGALEEGISQRAVADAFNVSQRLVWSIKAGEIWREK